MHETLLLWYRRDLRVSDHAALDAALRSARRVIPVYVLSNWEAAHRWTGANRQHFLCGCLASLAKNLEALGSGLVLREGNAPEALARLAKEAGATALFYCNDPDPFGKAVERRIASDPAFTGMEIRGFQDTAVHTGREVLTGSGTPFRVFTPYSKAWRKLPHPAPLPRPKSLPPLPEGIFSLPLPEVSRWRIGVPGAGILEAGECAAHTRLEGFLKSAAHTYQERRNIPGLAATSRLSQDLRFGTISARTITARVEAAIPSVPPQARKSLECYLNEIIWREFYFHILENFPEVLDCEFNPKLRGMPWPGRTIDLERWQQGLTGFPIVDAGMRELAETGFMHNRVRMITAMFLTKDLHVDWREGESWFMRRLADGEIASNNGGWQWSAGTGADAAPYFRIQNPWTQTARHDPDGAYIKKWVPELRGVDPGRFAEPPENGLPLAKGYPVPIVDHATERDKTLEIFNRWLGKSGDALRPPKEV